jgi:hypothetical protein
MPPTPEPEAETKARRLLARLSSQVRALDVYIFRSSFVEVSSQSHVGSISGLCTCQVPSVTLPKDLRQWKTVHAVAWVVESLDMHEHAQVGPEGKRLDRVIAPSTGPDNLTRAEGATLLTSTPSDHPPHNDRWCATPDWTVRFS